MSKTQTLTDQQRDKIISEAVRRRLHAAVNFRTASGWRTLKGRFCDSKSDDGAVAVCLLEPPAAKGTELLAKDLAVGCAFRYGHKKCMFCGTLRQVSVQDDTVVVELSRPDRIQQVQRRLFERAPVPGGTVIPVRFWREGANQGDGQRRNMRHGQLEDISLGGMRVQVSDLSDVQLEASYQCVFTPRPGSPAVVLDALLRHQEPNANGRVSLGLQFIGLETTPEGRRVIDRLSQTVQHFQRLQSRRGVGTATGFGDNDT